MHTEHLENLHPVWVVRGWLVAIAVAGAVFLVLVGVGLARPDARGVGAMVLVAVAVGFFSGGLFVGLRWSDAPILHGAAITFLHVLVWLLGELLFPGAVLRGEGLALALGVILVQLAAAVAGGWTGRRMVRRGATPSLEG